MKAEDNTISALFRTTGDDAPAGQDEAASIHESVQHLVTLDVANGGDQTSILATQALRTAEPLLAPGAYDPKAERDLQAAVAELAELTGWLLCDANQHAASLTRNRQALGLARLAGDHSMELFVIHNMSLQATYLRRPERTLELVHPILDQSRLTPRLSAMFQLRVARAYAQMGQRHMATKTLDTAIGLFYEGTSEHDPPWSWWLSARGFDHATGALLGSLGDWKAAIDPIQRALDAAPEHARRDRFLYLCILLHAQIKAGAWHDAAKTVEQLIPNIGQVRSTRPLTRLITTITDSPNVTKKPGMDDAIAALNHALNRSPINPSIRRSQEPQIMLERSTPHYKQ